VLCLPPVEGLFANPSLPDQLDDRNTHLCLIQDPDGSAPR
jgi:hypothetical protein